MTLLQITAPHFCAGIIIDNYICVKAAPILKWAINKNTPFLFEYFKWKGWKVAECKWREK